jgi:hypothetical protein
MNPSELIEKINSHFKIDMTKKSKKREVVFSRYVFFNIVANSNEKISMQRIGGLVNVSHATVSTGLSRCVDLDTDSEFLDIKKQITKLLN